ncbi:MAG: sigma-70 family RNA polymerase sigma factor [Terracidiphilus sp.]|jgi:RNA polymerase sigma-70 factor (ECF subfamily)
MQEDDQDAADAALVLAGDLNAFEGIVRRWQQRLVTLAWRFCRDRTLAEDMAQEAFFKAFRSLSAYRGEAAFSTWLTAIALNSYRSRLRAEGPSLLSLDPARTFSMEGDALGSLIRSEGAEAVRKAVLTLPTRYREAIVVFYFQEKSVAETATVLGIAEGTLKARLHRGRELLRHKCINLKSYRAMGNKEEQ